MSILNEIRDEWISPEQIAEAFDIDVSTVYRWLNTGLLGGVRLGKKWRITDTDIRSFIKTEKAKQDAKVEARQAKLAAQSNLKRWKKDDPDRRWEIATCSNCGLPCASDADITGQKACSTSCAEAMEIEY